MNEALRAALEKKRAELIERQAMVTAQLREQQIALAGAVAAVDEMLREMEVKDAAVETNEV